MNRFGSVGFLSLAAAACLVTPAGGAEIGLCKFDTVVMTFRGGPGEQAACLLRKVRPRGAASDQQPVPADLSARLGRPFDLSDGSVAAYLGRRGISPADIGGALAAGDASHLRYFVIHDTSSPELSGVTTFPASIDTPSGPGNNLTGWAGLRQRVNLLVSRDGRSRTFLDWKAPRSSPATKLEQNNVAAPSRRVFAHVENVQPRIKPAQSWAWIAPTPGLSSAQQRRLAEAYVVASLRAGRWLIPALHYNIDKGGPAGHPHDDPQNFDLAAWAADVTTVEAAVRAGN